MGNVKYIIYGAGKQGRTFLEFLKQKELDTCIIGFCDKRYDMIEKVSDKQVFCYDEAKKYRARFIVAVGDEEVGKKIIKMLEEDGQEYCSIDEFAKSANMSRVEFNREFCALFHVDNMDEYFESAEEEGSLGIFWNDASEFKKMFLNLDLHNVIELACGRGRHVPKYLSNAGHITLVDILSKNIEFCKNRFHDQKNITYYQNNGYNLRGLESGRYTALFSYDAMVHFEMLDINEYLIDIYRVLAPGGKGAASPFQ